MMNKTVIFYFSGTGNTWFVTNKIKDEMKDAKLIPVVSALNDNSFDVDAAAIGFVFPVYMMGLPLPLQQLVSKLNLDKAKYIFAVATRMGTTHAAFHIIDKLLKKKNRALDAYFNVTMPNNDTKFKFVAPSKEEIKQIEDVAVANIKQIASVIKAGNTHKEKDTTATIKMPKLLMNMLGGLGSKFNTKLHADDNCIGCGTCQKVCLSGKVKLVDKKPVWDKNIMCYKCSACIAYCPRKASQITKYTEGKDRYPHPYASIEDIAEQKV